MWSSSFNLPSPAAQSAQEFKIELLGVFKIGLLGDATFWRFLGIFSARDRRDSGGRVQNLELFRECSAQAVSFDLEVVASIAD